MQAPDSYGVRTVKYGVFWGSPTGVLVIHGAGKVLRNPGKCVTKVVYLCYTVRRIPCS